jgi:hypothetical protein
MSTKRHRQRYSYRDQKVIHLLRQFGKGQAGLHPVTFGACPKWLADLQGVRLITLPDLERDAFAR